MQYIVKQVNDRFNNGFYYKEMSFSDICKFFEGEEDEEVDSLIENVALLNVNQSYSYDFFGGNSYTFKRII
jgi:hypothetical protein